MSVLTKPRNLAVIFFGLAIGMTAHAEKDALVETAEALLAVARNKEEGRSFSDFDYDFDYGDDAARISQTVRVEREVNRDVFTSMLVETERDEFIKACEKAESLLKKWKEVEKALADGNPSEATSKTSSAPNKPEIKKPSMPKPSSLKKPSSMNKSPISGRKPLGIKPPSIKKPGSPSKPAVGPEKPGALSKPAVGPEKPGALSKPAVGAKKPEGLKKPRISKRRPRIGGGKNPGAPKPPAKPSGDKKDDKKGPGKKDEKKDDKKDEKKGPKTRRLRSLGRKGPGEKK